MSTSEFFRVLRAIKQVIAQLEDEGFDAHGTLTQTSTRTPQEARAWLDCQGVTIAQWARDNGFNERLAHEVLTGRRPCKRGQSHNIAVALGMKAGIPTTRPARVAPVQRNRLIAAVEAVEEGLAEVRSKLPPKKRAELIIAAYDLITDPELLTPSTRTIGGTHGKALV